MITLYSLDMRLKTMGALCVYVNKAISTRGVPTQE